MERNTTNTEQVYTGVRIAATMSDIIKLEDSKETFNVEEEWTLPSPSHPL